ncbi:beta-galactosidase [Nocardioides sp. WG-D5]
MYYGGDYNPEQFPPEVWKEDITLMREAGVNLVTVGVFSWSRIQRREGVYDWAWLDQILAMLHEGGIGVDLATATASPPPWAIAKFPDMLPVNEDGVTLYPGSRQHYAPSSRSYRRLASELVHALAERYANHPAVRMWHVNNEFGCHVARDYSESATVAFQDWLRARYGDIDELNEAWGTTFWSHIYGDFTEVLPPRRAPYSRNPGLLLDFRRFSSDAMLELLTMERDILRAHEVTQPITTNFMGAFAGANYWKWAPELDVVSDDNYPDPNVPDSFRESALARDLMRSLKPDTPWLLMEQSTDAVNWRQTNAPKSPGQMSALSAQAVARGANGILFFQWRQSERGAEQFFSAMVPHAGTRTRTWKEVTQLGSRLHAFPAMPPPGPADVALLFEWESWWALEGAELPVAVDYPSIIQSWYNALHERHVAVDFVNPMSRLSGYRMVIAPAAFLLTRTGAANIVDFVRGGGHLLVTAYSDIVDEAGGFRRGGFQTLLREATGVTTLDFGAMVPSPGVAGCEGPGESVAPVSGPEVASFEGRYLAEEIDILASGVDVHARFVGGRRRGAPALTSHNLGKGCAYYLATLPTDASSVTDWLLKRAAIPVPYPGLDSRVEAFQRGSWLALINHSDESIRARIMVSDASRSLRSVELGPYEWQMLPNADGVSNVDE